MSTEYEVYINQDRVRIALYEHSSKLDILFNNSLGDEFGMRNLTPVQIAAIGIEFMRIADYQDSDISQYFGHQFPSDEMQEWARNQLGRD